MAASFPFLTGCERSGTTLLRAMLDAHPDLAIPDESHFVPRLAARRAVLELGAGLDLDRLCRFLRCSPGFRRWGLDQGAVEDSLRTDPPVDLPAAIRRLYAMYAERAGAPRWADKTTTYVFHIEALAALLPEARFVHLIRDGRNVALSLLAVDWGPVSVEQAAAWWRARVEAGRRAGARLGPDRYLEIRFEALTRDPEPVLRRLTGFLGLPWTDDVLRYYERSDRLLETMPTKRQGHHRNVARPPSADLRDWRRELPAPSQFSFEALAGDLLGDLGYDRAFPSTAVVSCPRERRQLLARRPVVAPA
jgi:hypothetical protein